MNWVISYTVQDKYGAVVNTDQLQGQASDVFSSHYSKHTPASLLLW